jgi:Cft2 family RNA processing exonuclease
MHLGALPYAMKHLGLSAPVYATEPVFRLGLLTMYDHFLSRWVSFLVPNISIGVHFSIILICITTQYPSLVPNLFKKTVL